MADTTEPSGTEPAALTAQETRSETGETGDGPTAEGILPADHWTQAHPHEDDDDSGDSAIGDFASSTASITSTILRYRTLHGRTYHSEQGSAQYWGSNDEVQMESMDIAHHAFSLALNGKLHLAPLSTEKLHKVVDVGTGTGIWAIDFADIHPQAQVTGTDVSPIQPSWIPPNLSFVIEDCTQSWTFAADSLDYIHMRFLIGSIDSWGALMKRAFEACKPGGYVESMEPSAYLESDDGTVTDDMAMGQWGKFFVEGSRKFGRSFELYQQGTVRAALEEAGFVDIHETNLKVPIGGWPEDPRLKELGQFTQVGFLQDPEGYILFLANAMGWTREQIVVFLAHLKRELRSPKIHAFYRQKIVWARKPSV